MIDIVNQVMPLIGSPGLVRAYGPGGRIGIGGGWDLALLGLDLFLRGVEFDPAT